MKYFIKFILVFTIVLASCKNEKESEKKSNTPVIPFTEVGNQMRNEVATKSATQQNQNSAANTDQTALKNGINPAHGQPNHRCDLPVGAPLNSPNSATKSYQVSPKTNQTVTVTPPAASPTVITPTPEGINPPHGQTGHRCDIAVGAALPKE